MANTGLRSRHLWSSIGAGVALVLMTLMAGLSYYVLVYVPQVNTRMCESRLRRFTDEFLLLNLNVLDLVERVIEHSGMHNSHTAVRTAWNDMLTGRQSSCEFEMLEERQGANATIWQARGVTTSVKTLWIVVPHRAEGRQYVAIAFGLCRYGHVELAQLVAYNPKYAQHVFVKRVRSYVEAMTNVQDVIDAIEHDGDLSLDESRWPVVYDIGSSEPLLGPLRMRKAGLGK